MRTYDATPLNRIANHPDVAKGLEWDQSRGLLTFDKLAQEPAYFALLHDQTCRLGMVFEWSAPGVWQIHTMSLPEFLGKDMIEAAKKLIYEMFVEHQACVIWGQPPLTNRAARMFNRVIGAKSVGFGHHHIAGPVEYFMNNREDWLNDHWKG